MWALVHTAARVVEGWHSRTLQRIVRVQCVEGEARDTFCRRRNRVVQAARDGAGLCITREWALCLVRWLEHLKRHPDFPAAQLLEVQDDLWLQTLRALHPSADGVSLSAGRTGTRGGAGKPNRWWAFWVAALTDELGVDNPLRDRDLTSAQATVLKVIMRHGRWHGRAIAL